MTKIAILAIHQDFCKLENSFFVPLMCHVIVLISFHFTPNMESQVTTQTVQISILKKESNIPIYQTNVCPISYSKVPPKIAKKEINGVPVDSFYF